MLLPLNDRIYQCFRDLATIMDGKRSIASISAECCELCQEVANLEKQLVQANETIHYLQEKANVITH